MRNILILTAIAATMATGAIAKPPMHHRMAHTDSGSAATRALNEKSLQTASSSGAMTSPAMGSAAGGQSMNGQPMNGQPMNGQPMNGQSMNGQSMAPPTPDAGTGMSAPAGSMPPEPAPMAPGGAMPPPPVPQ